MTEPELPEPSTTEPEAPTKRGITGPQAAVVVAVLVVLVALVITILVLADTGPYCRRTLSDPTCPFP